MKVRYLSEAQEDISEAIDWYSKQSDVAPQRFLDEVEAALKRIDRIGKSFSLVDSRHRECALKRFPYRVVYRFTDDAIIVVAVAHTRRKRMFWRRRD